MFHHSLLSKSTSSPESWSHTHTHTLLFCVIVSPRVLSTNYRSVPHALKGLRRTWKRRGDMVDKTSQCHYPGCSSTAVSFEITVRKTLRNSSGRKNTSRTAGLDEFSQKSLTFFLYRAVFICYCWSIETSTVWGP